MESVIKTLKFIIVLWDRYVIEVQCFSLLGDLKKPFPEQCMFFKTFLKGTISLLSCKVSTPSFTAIYLTPFLGKNSQYNIPFEDNFFQVLINLL